MNRMILVLLLTLFHVNGVNAATPVYDVVAGQLVGIKNVDVSGVLYDVKFTDDSFDNIFAAGADLDFTTLADALAAATALETLLTDGPDGNFDTIPSLTHGCEVVSPCYIVTPYGPPGSDVSLENTPPLLDFVITDLGWAPGVDFTTINTAVYAEWMPSAPISLDQVSAPYVLPLAALGFGLLILLGRQRRQRG